ncbi:MAG: S8 family peptidase [Chloroflexi bacterium]|nr:S8 family peptidase [Chloroflexota bacterium]
MSTFLNKKTFFLLMILLLGLFVIVHEQPVQANNEVIQALEDTIIPGQYLVVFEEEVLQARRVSINTLAQNMAEEVDGTIVATYEHALQGFAAQLSEEGVEELRNRPEVSHIVADRYATLSDTQYPTPSWGLDRIDQHDLPLDNRYNYDSYGAGVHLYIIDSGIRGSHTDFSGRLGNGISFVGGSANEDCSGHGTHVASTTGGSTYGIAKGVTIHSVRIDDCDNITPWTTLISGINWVMANHQSPSVTNMSWGGGIYPDADTAVSNAIASGVTFVLGAGNDNADACNYSPARVSAAITVGATSANDKRGYYPDPGWGLGRGSNIGSCVDIFAPGTSIIAAIHTNDSGSTSKSGTSMAAPHVAGVAALRLGDYPTQTPAQVWAAIRDAATLNHLTNIGSGSPNRLLFSFLPFPTNVGHLHQSLWRNNQNFSRTVPIVNGQIQWNSSSAWAGPSSINGMPGSGNIQAQSIFIVGNQLEQSLWRGNQGWHRIVPIVNNQVQWGSASTWYGPYALNTLPGSGSVQAQSTFVVGNQLEQSLWRGNQGWHRIVPIVNNQVQWGSASTWYGPYALNTLPGSGSIQAQSTAVVDNTLEQGFWRGNQGWYRTVPIVNNQVQWGSAASWYGPISLSNLPGSGTVQAQSDFVILP